MVFSTRGRAQLMKSEIEARLYPFIGGVLRDLNCTALAINGMPDHLHILAGYPANLSHSDMLRHVKSRSSKWIHQTFPLLASFAWQEGYGSFTGSMSMTATVEAYIAGQKEHHTGQDFSTEFVELLRKHEVEFNEVEVLK